MVRGAISVADHVQRLEPHFTVLLPEGPGPHPVVVQLHGCGGLQPFHRTYAEAARAVGYASVVVDSFMPRGISKRAAQMTICTGLRLRGAERAADIFAVLHWLEGQSWADVDRVALAGWSHGGWTIMDALAGAYGVCGLTDGGPERLERVRAVFLVYPYAGIPSLTVGRGWGPHRPRVFAVLGTRDAVSGQVMPRLSLKRLSRDGLEVEILTLEGATHAFDDPDAEDPRSRYDEGQAARTRDFLVESLRTAFAD